MSRVVMLSQGFRPRLHAGLLWSIAHATRPFHHRGVQWLTWEMAPFFFPDDAVTLQVAPGTRLILPLDDGYWTKLLDPRFRYEPEVEDFLDRTLTRGTYFLDCGANIGLWSLIFRDRARRVVAVEASPGTFARLEANVNLNRANITLLHAALWDADGKTLEVFDHPRHHAGSTVTEMPYINEEGWQATAVTTLTLRTMIENHCPDTAAPIVIKLDVEGAEFAAIDGAGDLLHQRDIGIVYEDHGVDLDCKLTAHMREVGMATFDLTTGEELTLDQVRATKHDVMRGYNFLAASRNSFAVPRVT